MSTVDARVLEDLLVSVQKPVRYIGNEWNSTVRDGDDIDVRLALAFPDTYEIGMSHLGFRILYSLLNKMDGVAAERAFAPWQDMEEALRANEIPLYSLETKRPLGELDMLGFSIQAEMTLSNVLTMLDLSGQPLLAADRTDGHPLVLAGGPVVMNPEPFADIFDLIAIGDGEELFPELVLRYRELRDGGASRAEIVSQLGQIEGMYAPIHYELETDERTGLQVVVGSPTHPFPVKRRLAMDLSATPFPEDIIVPFGEIVHSRVAVEIQRGCNVGCRFCQAGYIYRPERRRTPEDVLKTAVGSAAKTGFDTVSLTSLNTGEYPGIESLMDNMFETFEDSTTAVSLPSLRAVSLRSGLLKQLSRVRKSGLTIAPEGGTQRMRDVINKNITTEDIHSAAESAYSAGWDLLKLYFMIGQPTEQEDDVLGIAETARTVHGIGKTHRGNRARVNLGVSSFIPKPFTPFQWMPMERPETLMDKQHLIAKSLGSRAIKFGRHDVATSVLESALSRGDRRLAKVIVRAYKAGARFDGWTEHFDYELWRQAFEDEGLSLSEYAHLELQEHDRLPWDHVDIGLKKSWLWREWEKALKAETLRICDPSNFKGNCNGCGPIAKSCMTVPPHPQMPMTGREIVEPPPQPPSFTYRVHYAKTGWTRFISHLDVARTLRHAMRRSDVPLAYSQGFHPMPKISFAPPLPLGSEGMEEVFDLSVLEDFEPEELLKRLREQLPVGLTFSSLVRLTSDVPPLKELNAGRYVIRLDGTTSDEELTAAVETLLARPTIPVTRRRKGRESEVDVRPGILSLEAKPGARLEAEIRILGSGNVRPREIVKELLGVEVPGSRFMRSSLLIVSEDGQLGDFRAGRTEDAA